MNDEEIAPLFRELDEIAPDGYNFGFHIRFSRPTMVRLTYDFSWSQAYSRSKFILNDPAVIWGLMNDEPKRWSEIPLPDPLGVFAAAQAHGYRYGFSVGYGPAETRSLGACGSKVREFRDDEIARVAQIVRTIHEIMDGAGGLKSYQISALEKLEAGLTYDQICEALGISRTALKNRLGGARRMLGAATNQEAMRIALERGLIESTSYTGIVQGYPSKNGDD